MLAIILNRLLEPENHVYRHKYKLLWSVLCITALTTFFACFCSCKISSHYCFDYANVHFFYFFLIPCKCKWRKTWLMCIWATQWAFLSSNNFPGKNIIYIFIIYWDFLEACAGCKSHGLFRTPTFGWHTWLYFEKAFIYFSF